MILLSEAADYELVCWSEAPHWWRSWLPAADMDVQLARAGLLRLTLYDRLVDPLAYDLVKPYFCVRYEP